jgi:hypothetical protein
LTFTTREARGAALVESLGAVVESISPGEHGLRAHERLRGAARLPLDFLECEVRVEDLGGDLGIARSV